MLAYKAYFVTELQKHLKVSREVKNTTATHVHNKHLTNMLNLVCFEAEVNAKKASLCYSNSHMNPDKYTRVF